MKNKIAFFLLSVATFLHAQAPLNFTARLNVTNVTGSDPYTLTGVIQDELSKWSAADLNVSADSIYHLEGSDLLIYRITSITSASGNNFVIVVDDIMDSGLLPSTGVEWAAIAFTTNYQYPIETGNLASPLKSAIDNRFKQRLDAQPDGGNNVFSSVNFTTLSPSGTAPSNGDWLFHTRRGAWYERVSGNWAQRSTRRGDNVRKEQAIQLTSSTNMFFNANTYNKCYVIDSLDCKFGGLSGINADSTRVGDIYVFEVENTGFGALTVEFDTFNFKAFSNVNIPPQTVRGFGKRVFRFMMVDYIGEIMGLVSMDDLFGSELNIATSGFYTPTITKEVSTDTIVTIYDAQYLRTNNTVSVSGRILMNSLTGTGATSFYVSLPPGITSNFTDLLGDVTGVASTRTNNFPSVNKPAWVAAQVTTDEIHVFLETDGNAGTRQYVSWVLNFKIK